MFRNTDKKREKTILTGISIAVGLAGLGLVLHSIFSNQRTPNRRPIFDSPRTYTPDAMARHGQPPRSTRLNSLK